jgi:uncharacterized protein YunC (DUF1805 family)
VTEAAEKFPADQILLLDTDMGRVSAMDSAYMVCAANARDVVVNASYCGVLPARFIGRHCPRGSIGIDCAVGPAGAAIAGLWYLEALQIPAAVADVASVILGDGVDLYENGFISYLNDPAANVGVARGMSVRDAALCMLESRPKATNAEQITNRREMYRNGAGRAVVCLDSIAFGTEADRCNVLVTAGHSGRSALPYFLKVRPHAFICSDGGMGRDASGVAGMHEAADFGIAGAAVDARLAMMGSGVSSYEDGVISAVNALAGRVGVREGMAAAEAATLLADAEFLA